MPNIVDLSLCTEARRTLSRVLSDRGLGFFVKPGSRASMHLDSRRIAWVVEVARRAAGGPDRRRHDPDELARTRRVVRRELIRRMAEQMVRAGL